MPLQTIKVENPNGLNMIMGQSHFTETVEDIYKALIARVPGIQFGVAFSKASKPSAVKHSGTDDGLVDLAMKNVCMIGAENTFVLFMNHAFPVSVMRALREVPQICKIYCATAKPVEVIVIENEKGRGVMGLVRNYAS